MPFYDLRCPACDKEYNIRASISDKSEKRIKCPDCGSADLETVYKSAPNYIKNMKTQECPNMRTCGRNCPHAN